MNRPAKNFILLFALLWSLEHAGASPLFYAHERSCRLLEDAFEFVGLSPAKKLQKLIKSAHRKLEQQKRALVTKRSNIDARERMLRTIEAEADKISQEITRLVDAGERGLARNRAIALHQRKNAAEQLNGELAAERELYQQWINEFKRAEFRVADLEADVSRETDLYAVRRLDLELTSTFLQIDRIAGRSTEFRELQDRSDLARAQAEVATSERGEASRERKREEEIGEALLDEFLKGRTTDSKL